MNAKARVPDPRGEQPERLAAPIAIQPRKLPGRKQRRSDDFRRPNSDERPLKQSATRATDTTERIETISLMSGSPVSNQVVMSWQSSAVSTMLDSR